MISTKNGTQPSAHLTTIPSSSYPTQPSHPTNPPHRNHRFYVNIHTKQSTWERPTSPVYPTPLGAPPGSPPSYPGAGNTTSGGSSSYSVGGAGSTYPPEKGLSSNNPYTTQTGTGSHQNLDEDARYAQQLQAEEDARARAAGRPTSSEALERGESDSYYQGGGAAQGAAYGQGQQGGQQSYDQQQLPPRDAAKKGGIGGFLSKLGGGRHSQPQQSPYGQQGGYGQGGYGQQGGYGGGGAPGYGGYPQQQQGYGGGYGQQGPYGGYPQQQQQPAKRHGLGAGGGAALGLGGGLLGGMLLGEAMDGGDGGGDGGDGGGDGGGGDDGGGGGDF